MPAKVFTATGESKGTLALPETLFASPINWGLMHQMLVLQQSNRRQSAAHVKTRGEVQGSTKKLYAQKHTGQARRGPIRSPLLRGGGKAFGPRNDKNFVKNMPQQMRHAAIRSCLSVQAGKDAILILENYPETIKTKTLTLLLQKLPVEMGRRIVIVLPSKMQGLSLSARNIPRVTTLDARYLNPEDILGSKHVIFLKDAIGVAEGIFGQKGPRGPKEPSVKDVKAVKVPQHKKTKKAAAKKKASPSPQ